MKNKFKIRNLENEKRRIDKLIDKLRREDEERAVEEKFLGVITEERESVIKTDRVTKTINQVFTYSFRRKGNTIECVLSDGTSTIKGVGVAKCHSEDLFSERVGCTIAECRAIADYYKQIEKIEVRRYN